MSKGKIGWRISRQRIGMRSFQSPIRCSGRSETEIHAVHVSRVSGRDVSAVGLVGRVFALYVHPLSPAGGPETPIKLFVCGHTDNGTATSGSYPRGVAGFDGAMDNSHIVSCGTAGQPHG